MTRTRINLAGYARLHGLEAAPRAEQVQHAARAGWTVSGDTLTRYTITDEQIITLGEEAGRAGDFDMVAICERAIDGDDEARAECCSVIRDAEAQRND